MRLLLWIFQFAFGCHHNKLGSIVTIKRRTYQVCLQCGQEFPYSWELMRSVGPSARRPMSRGSALGKLSQR
jgi:hypothetical protein